MDKVSHKIYNSLYIFAFCEIFACITMIICLCKVNLPNKNLLFVLPLGYLVISMIFVGNFSNILNHFSVLIMTSLYYVRLVILPLLYTFSIDIQLFEGKSGVEVYFSKACILMVYEYFIVQFMIYCYEHWKKSDKIKYAGCIFFRTDISKAIIVFLGIYIFIIAILMPQYATSFKTIFELSDVDFSTAIAGSKYSIGTIGRILKTLFSMSVQLFRILFPAFLIRQSYERTSGSKICVLILLISCILQFMFLTSTFAEAIVSCLAIILYYIELYPNRQKSTLIFLGISTLGMIILYFTVRYFVKANTGLYSKGSGGIAYAAQIINAYFTGVDNVAAIFNIPNGHENESFWAGVIGAIPFNSTLFGDRGNKLQYYYNLYNNSYGQIPPTIGTGNYYFGMYLSPMITGLFVLMSMRYYRASKEVDVSLEFVPCIFCSVVFALGTVMYSPSITLAWYFGWGLPMLLITKFTNTSKGRKT